MDSGHGDGGDPADTAGLGPPPAHPDPKSHELQIIWDPSPSPNPSPFRALFPLEFPLEFRAAPAPGGLGSPLTLMKKRSSEGVTRTSGVTGSAAKAEKFS